MRALPIISLRETATCMSRINRWAGKGAFALSIAQHSALLSYSVPRRLRLAAVLHDLSEVSLGGDVISVYKDKCPDLQREEERIQRAIFSQYDVPWEHMEELHPFDLAIRFDERAALWPNDQKAQLEKQAYGLGVPVEPMIAEHAAEAWLWALCHHYFGDDGHVFH